MNVGQNSRKLQFNAIEIYSVNVTQVTLKQNKKNWGQIHRYISVRRLNPFTSASLYTENVLISITAHTSEKLT